MLQIGFEKCVCKGSLTVKPRRLQQVRKEEVSWFPKMAAPAESVQVNLTWLEIPQPSGMGLYGGGIQHSPTDISQRCPG